MNFYHFPTKLHARLKSQLLVLSLFLSASLLISNSVSAQINNPFDHEHLKWTAILKKVVTVNAPISRVNYQTLIQNKHDLYNYLSSLQAVSKVEYQQYTPDQQLAFLINTYNARQMQQVIEHYPIASIKEAAPFYSTPWNTSFFTLFGEDSTLNTVEHQYIRKQFKEPRIHFAVNCASIGCPPILNEAYTASKLEAQLEAATINFLGNKKLNYYQADGSAIILSKIFDWYEDDFGDVIKFVRPYLPNQNGVKTMPLRTLKIKYSSYDWSLNEN